MTTCDLKGVSLHKGATMNISLNEHVTFSEIILLLVNYKSNKMFSVSDIRTYYNVPNLITVSFHNTDEEQLQKDVNSVEKYFLYDRKGDVTTTETINAMFDAINIEKAIQTGEMKIYNADEKGIKELVKKLTVEDKFGETEFVHQIIADTSF